MKSFQKQFQDCKKGGYLGSGETIKYKDDPESLPHPFSKLHKISTDELKKIQISDMNQLLVLDSVEFVVQKINNVKK